MIDGPYFPIFFFLILHGHAIELTCVTIDKENEWTTGIELLVMQFNFVSFSRRREKSKCFCPTVIAFSVRMISLRQHILFNTVG